MKKSKNYSKEDMFDIILFEDTESLVFKNLEKDIKNDQDCTIMFDEIENMVANFVLPIKKNRNSTVQKNEKDEFVQKASSEQISVTAKQIIVNWFLQKNFSMEPLSLACANTYRRGEIYQRITCKNFFLFSEQEFATIMNKNNLSYNIDDPCYLVLKLPLNVDVCFNWSDDVLWGTVDIIVSPILELQDNELQTIFSQIQIRLTAEDYDRSFEVSWNGNFHVKENQDLVKELLHSGRLTCTCRKNLE